MKEGIRSKLHRTCVSDVRGAWGSKNFHGEAVNLVHHFPSMPVLDRGVQEWTFTAALTRTYHSICKVFSLSSEDHPTPQ